MGVRERRHDIDEEALALDAVIRGPTYEIVGPRPIEVHGALSVVKGRDGFGGVAVVVVPFLHHQH